MWKYCGPRDIFFSEQKKLCLCCVKALTGTLPVLDLDFLEKEICNPNWHFPVQKKGYKYDEMEKEERNCEENT